MYVYTYSLHVQPVGVLTSLLLLGNSDEGIREDGGAFVGGALESTPLESWIVSRVTEDALKYWIK